MDFTVFDTRKMDEYARQAKETWGNTEEYREMLERSKNWSEEDEDRMQREFMDLFVRFGKMLHLSPAEPAVQDLVGQMQAFITEHLYNCKPKILQGLGKMYAGGGSITESIDQAAGAGTAAFVAKAIEVWCERGEEM